MSLPSRALSCLGVALISPMIRLWPGRHFASFLPIIAKPPQQGSGCFLPGGRPPVNVLCKGGRSPNGYVRLPDLARPGTPDPILATQHSGVIDVTRLRPVAVLEARESDTLSDQRGGVRTGRRATFMVRDETIVSLPFSKYVAPDVRHGSFADFRFG